MKYKEFGRKIPENDEYYSRIGWVKSQFDKHEEYYKPETQRLIRNQRMVWGVGFGQWPSYAVEKMSVEGRRAPTYNVIGKKVEQMVSSYSNNDFDIQFAPVNGKVDQLSQYAQDLYYSDKHHMKWKISRRIALRDCFTMVGYERMLISDKYHEFGNIAFECVNPAHLFIDIGWKSQDPEDIRHYFEWGMFTPAEIMDMFPNKSEKLKELKMREEVQGTDFGIYHGGIRSYNDTESKWGDRHRVIFYHFIKKHERNWEYDIVNKCDFPETGYKAGSEEDRAVKIEYIRRMGLDPNFDVTWRKQIIKEKMVEAICPTIDTETFLTAGKDKVQTGNCNIYPIGDSWNGQFKGIADDLYDNQISINKMEQMIDDIQIRSAKGAFVLDRALAGGDPQKENEIEQQWNNPAARIWVDEGSTYDLGPKGGIIELPGVKVTSDMFNQVNRRYNLVDWFSVPAAMDARSEGANESGRLYLSKYKAAQMSQKYGMEIFEAHEVAKAMAYIKQAKITYAGYPRTFNKAGSKDNFEINQRIQVVGQNGEASRATINDISLLPEMLVSATPGRKGITVRQDMREEYLEVLQFMQDPNDRLAKLVFESGLVQTYELSDEKKEELEMAFQILKTNAALEQAVLNKTLKSQLMVAEQGPGQQMPQGQKGGALPPQISEGVPDRETAEEGTPQQRQDMRIIQGNT